MMNRLNKWLHATKINCFEVFKTVLCFKIINGNSIFTALFQLRFWQPVLILHVAISQLRYTIISTALHYFQIRWTYLEIWRQFTPSQLFFLCYTSEGEKSNTDNTKAQSSQSYTGSFSKFTIPVVATGVIQESILEWVGRLCRALIMNRSLITAWTENRTKCSSNGCWLYRMAVGDESVSNRGHVVLALKTYFIKICSAINHYPAVIEHIATATCCFLFTL